MSFVLHQIGAQFRNIPNRAAPIVMEDGWLIWFFIFIYMNNMNFIIVAQTLN